MNPIKERMLNLNITFTELQEETGLSKATIARLIKNDEIPDNTRLSTLKTISHHLECPVSDLLSSHVPSYSLSSPTVVKKALRNEIDSITFSYKISVNFGTMNNSRFKIKFFQDTRTKNLTRLVISLEKDSYSMIGYLISNNYQKTLMAMITNMIQSCPYELSETDKNNALTCDFNAFFNSEFLTFSTFIFDFTDYSKSHFVRLIFK
ncbi:helix-turn-helix domain-containing protein [Lactiplantibacillus plantarum]|uniref:helix-turn-helix domain-containing protein n=1 Tax=Lactiplantibacillus plantarum TaxID=1590 RepID=UPI0021822F4F|nr:helix-turn-helix transcriptional regulator [Lactiplantibacillus plantarum]MCT0195663.1 XRE family transcriptional regulator [Lactiplantibacillus plantarum]